MSCRDNHWTVSRKLLAGWQPRIPVRADAPEHLLAWVVDILCAAERWEVGRFLREDQTFWQTDDLRGHLHRRLAEDGIVDVFKFATFDGVASKLAYFGTSGVEEELVADTGKLLQRLRPGADAYTYVDRGSSPLRFAGHAISFDPAKDAPLSASKLPSVSMRVAFQTDIWLPWVPGGDVSPRPERFHDNRPLAERHTTRLNAFLRWLRDSAIARGGSWEVLRYAESEWIEPMVGADGIDLTIAAPLMTAAYPSYSRGATQ